MFFVPLQTRINGIAAIESVTCVPGKCHGFNFFFICDYDHLDDD